MSKLRLALIIACTAARICRSATKLYTQVGQTVAFWPRSPRQAGQRAIYIVLLRRTPRFSRRGPAPCRVPRPAVRCRSHARPVPPKPAFRRYVMIRAGMDEVNRPARVDAAQRLPSGSTRSWRDGLAEPASVRWVDNQHRRWGSCTPADRSIRLSSRLRSMPEYVVDYVLVHELVHLLEPNHDERFWAWVARYPRAERARGFLEGVELASTAGAAAAQPPGTVD